MKLTKEDIQKYGTPKERKNLMESRIYNSSTSFTHADVAKIAQKIDYDILDACDFCLQLLEDVNAYEIMAQVEEVMENSPMLRDEVDAWDDPHRMWGVE
jgi:hypothetical protein